MSVPRWVPLLGAVKQEVEDTRRHLRDLRDLPMEHVQKDMEAGKQGGGMISQILRETDQGDVDSEGRIHRLKDMASSTYAASSETTASTIATFFLVMARNTQAQRRAQQEIDSVVGRSRLPAIEDRGNLPYIEAIYIEILRLRPPSPMGVPHRTAEPDHYRGYYIPQGATVVGNIWAMTRDERVYPEPEEFKPERFLNTNMNINDILAYGFGRRVCVGRHLADALLWLTFASVLACFNIEKEKDEQGNDVDIPVLYSDGPGTFS
ncbi:hypothetical protein VNI00_010745 [Paramarasmius palmivorus]|uniref:Cytochrome P450 n=1 Tax=Paramarasmius palmivorus TaxID=297713 RepID=A0AAW0CF74_9AGAR